MYVTEESIQEATANISLQKRIAVDTETTGLLWYKEDLPFCITISTHDMDYYFDLKTIKDLSPLIEMFEKFEGIIEIQNAKFDLHMLENIGINLLDKDIFCTWAMGRLENNNRLSYSLDAWGKELNYEKDDTVKKYISKNKLYKLVHIPFTKEPKKLELYSEVPLELIQPYALRDTRLTYKVADILRPSLIEQEIPLSLIENEKKATKYFYAMEKRGIAIDEKYIEDAIKYEHEKLTTNEQSFEEISGDKFQDAEKVLTKVFKYLNLNIPQTLKGRNSFTGDYLKSLDHPIGEIIIKIREATKRLQTYSLIQYNSKNGVCHCSFLQAGTGTGRISIVDPALQCIEKPDEDNPDQEPYNLRGCFVPRPGYKFVMMDYDQFEYRMFVNIADETELINKILSGLDVHSATAQMLNITRKQAKTLNFMLLYGGGTQKLADSLKITYAEARDIKYQYFANLPKIQQTVNQVSNIIKYRGYLKNLFGRRYYFDKGFEYRGVNYLIQGSTADWIKFAMSNIADYLKDYKSKMLLQIHDEILFEVHDSEDHIIPQLKDFMQNVSKKRPHDKLPYTVGIDYSYKSWKDKLEWGKSGT